MKRGHLSSLARLALIAGASTAGTAHAGIYPYLGTVDSPGVMVTTQGVLISAANQLTNIMENRLRHNKPCMKPINKTAREDFQVGNPFTGFSVWGNAEYDHLHSSLSSTNHNGHITYLSGGFDTSLNSLNGVLGLGVTWENENFDTLFNWGYQDEEGWGLYPYFAMALSDCWSFMILGGYEWLDYEMQRVDHITVTELTGAASGSRYFVGGELVFQNYYCNWDVGIQTALLYLHEHNRGFYEYSDRTYSVYNSSHENHLGRFKLGASLGYLLCNNFEPYVRAAFLWDFSHTDILVSAIQEVPANSDTSGLFGIGLNFFSTDNVVFNADLYTEQFRDDFRHWGAMVNFRVTL